MRRYIKSAPAEEAHQGKLPATSSSCAAVAAKQKPAATRVRHFRDWLRAATTGTSQAPQTLESPAEPDVRVGDGATTRRIDSTSASTQLVFSAPCKAESDEVIGIGDVRSRAFGLMSDTQLCGGADQDSLVGVELGRRAECEEALRTG